MLDMRKWIFLFWMAMFIAGCDLIEYHPYDVRLSGKLDINKKNIPLIEEAEILNAGMTRRKLS